MEPNYKNLSDIELKAAKLEQLEQIDYSRHLIKLIDQERLAREESKQAVEIPQEPVEKKAK